MARTFTNSLIFKLQCARTTIARHLNRFAIIKEFDRRNFFFFKFYDERFATALNLQHQVFYRNIYVFVNRLKNVVFRRKNNKLRNIIFQCLKNIALI